MPATSDEHPAHATSALPWRTLGEELRATFGEPVRKIAIDAGFTCPNRDGRVARGGCTYCDSRGSGPGPDARILSVREQVARAIADAASRPRAAEKFLAYFQPFTNTYAPVRVLRDRWDEALDHPQVVGLDIATRPDCVPDEVLDLVAEFSRRTYLWLELGLQSASDATLRRINRGHTAAQFADAVERAHARGIRVVAHVILGFPWESPDEMRETVRLCARLGVAGIKLHSLYLVPGTALYDEVRRDGLRLLTREEYVSIAADALEILPPATVIHRVTGDPPPGVPPEPAWTADKAATIRMVAEEVRRRRVDRGLH